MQNTPHQASTQPTPAFSPMRSYYRVQAKLPGSNRGQNRMSAAMVGFLKWSQEEGWAFARKHIVFLGSYLYKTLESWCP